MNKKKSKLVLILVSLMAWSIFHASVAPPAAAAATIINFDFDAGQPALPSGRSTPFNHTVGGVTAGFSSPTDPAAFSVQRYETTFLKLSQLSGKYLYDNNLITRVFDVRFSAPLTNVTLTFATIEYHGGAGSVPSNVTVTAYIDAVGTTPVGSATNRGTWPTGDSYPQGKVSLDSGGQPFNLVRVELPYQGTKRASDFMVDNIVVTLYEGSIPEPPPDTGGSTGGGTTEPPPTTGGGTTEPPPDTGGSTGGTSEPPPETGGFTTIQLLSVAAVTAVIIVVAAIKLRSK